MAKTAVRKRAKSTALRFISDHRHGWVEVPANLCKKLGLGTDFTRRGKYCYLEEDAEAYDLHRAAKKHKVPVTYIYHDMDDFDAWLGCPTWPYIPACVYGDDAELVAQALRGMAKTLRQRVRDATHTEAKLEAIRKQLITCDNLVLVFSTMTVEE